MTEQEKQEFWKKQTLFTMKDVIKTSSGAILLKPDAMARVATEYQLALPNGKIYTLREARDMILNAEIKRREKPLENASVEETKPELSDDVLKVVSYFRIVPASKKNNTLFIAKELTRLFTKTKQSDVVAAINEAKAQGLITDAEEITKEYKNQLGLKALSINIEKFKMTITDQNELNNKISNLIFYSYKHGYSYGQLNLTLQNSSLSPEAKNQVLDRFYELLMPEIAERYKDTKYRGSLLAKDILEHYSDFDMNRIFAILDVTTENLDVDYVRYQAYCQEDEPFIKDILIDGNRKRMSAAEIAAALKETGSEYPVEFIIRTIRDIQKMKLILPYDDIVNALQNPQKEEDPVEEELQPEITELHPAVRDRFELSVNGEFIDVTLPEQEEENNALQPVESRPLSAGKKHKIVKREKATTAIDKKAVIAALVVAAGAISTAVLTSIFGVSPLEAAKNAAASIATFTAGNVFFSKIIPTTVELVKNLATFGLATAGTLAWLKRRKAKKKEQRRQEILEVLEEVRNEEAERGGRTR